MTADDAVLQQTKNASPINIWQLLMQNAGLAETWSELEMILTEIHRVSITMEVDADVGFKHRMKPKIHSKLDLVNFPVFTPMNEQACFVHGEQKMI